MNRTITTTLLLAGVVASALWWIYTLHESRSLFLQLEQLSEQRDEAMAEWSRLQIEQATFADASQVERIARERLDMTSPKQLEILVIRP